MNNKVLTNISQDLTDLQASIAKNNLRISVSSIDDFSNEFTLVNNKVSLSNPTSISSSSPIEVYNGYSGWQISLGYNCTKPLTAKDSRYVDLSDTYLPGTFKIDLVDVNGNALTKNIFLSINIANLDISGGCTAGYNVKLAFNDITRNSSVANFAGNTGISFNASYAEYPALNTNENISLVFIPVESSQPVESVNYWISAFVL